MSAPYRCDGCGETFSTLSRKRLHDCPSGARYGGDEPTEEYDVDGESADAIAEKAVEKALVCDVCEESSDASYALEHSVTSRGVAFTVKFDCENCGAYNENTATIE